jgi:integrase
MAPILKGHVRARLRPDGTVRAYQARMPDPLRPGKKLERTFPAEAEAQAWLLQQNSALADGSYAAKAKARRDGQRTFADLVDVWRSTRYPALAPRSQERYDSVIDTYLLHPAVDTPWRPHQAQGRYLATHTTTLASLDRAAVKLYFARLAQHKAAPSPGTIKKVHTVLSAILTEAVELGWLETNPAARLRLATKARTPKKAMTILTPAEITQVADAATAHIGRPQDGLAIRLAAYSGARAGELWALRREDYDPLHRRLHITKTLTTRSGYLQEGPTKTDRPRSATLPHFLATQLDAHLATLPPDPDARLFTSPQGGPVRHELWMRRVWRPATQGTPARPATPKTQGHPAQPARPAVPSPLPAHKQAIRFHDLRHTCASLLIDAGASVVLVAQRLGHADPSMTLRVYSHMYPSAEAALADALDAAHAAPPKPTDAPTPLPSRQTPAPGG